MTDKWTPEQFWEFVAGYAGDYESAQMRDMMTERGLTLSSTPCPRCHGERDVAYVKDGNVSETYPCPVCSQAAEGGREAIARIIDPTFGFWDEEPPNSFQQRRANRALEKADAILALGPALPPQVQATGISAGTLDNLLSRLDQGAAYQGYPEGFGFSWTQLAGDAASVIRRLRASPPAPVADRVAVIEECAGAALEQRCERGTPWDLACVEIAKAIRALALPRADRGTGS